MSSHVDDDPTASRNVPRLFAVRFCLYLRQLFALRVISTASAGVGCEAPHRLRYFLKSIQTFLRSIRMGFVPSQASVYLRERPFSLTTWCCGIPPHRGCWRLEKGWYLIRSYWLLKDGWSLIRSCMKTLERNKGLIPSTRVWCIDCQRLPKAT